MLPMTVQQPPTGGLCCDPGVLFVDSVFEFRVNAVGTLSPTNHLQVVLIFMVVFVLFDLNVHPQFYFFLEIYIFICENDSFLSLLYSIYIAKILAGIDY